jgi:hypothetical protein
MKTKRLFQILVVIAILVSSFATAGSAHAWYNCASYITVQWGDTLSGLAAYCGTTVSAIRAANPGLGWWVYAGQVIVIPASSYPVYVPPPPPPPVVVVTPPATPPAGFEGVLTVIAGKGVNIRNQPSYTGKIVLADDYTKGKTFYYRTNSVTKDDAFKRTWVEVVLSQSGTTITTGWLPVSGPQDYIRHTGPIEDWVTPHIQ